MNLLISSVFISGIGYALVKALAAGGAETIALSRTQEDLDGLKAEVTVFVFYLSNTNTATFVERVMLKCGDKSHVEVLLSSDINMFSLYRISRFTILFVLTAIVVC